jgi:hypothetical protein
MTFSEFAILLLVALIVLGPKELPRYAGRAGVLVGRLGRWARPSTKSQSRNAKLVAFAFAFAAACTVALALTFLASRGAH